MDFVTNLPWTQRRHDAVWVIVDRFTKSAHFLVVRMTFILEEFCWLYIRESRYMECQSRSYWRRIPDLRHTFRRVFKRPWGYS